MTSVRSSSLLSFRLSRISGRVSATAPKRTGGATREIHHASPKPQERWPLSLNPNSASPAPAVFFTHTSPTRTQDVSCRTPDRPPPDERTLQLGKTVRVLHERLPTLLKEPLPSNILSPQITLHLFPSTHPHLPTVSGRIAYIAALWTAPVAWGRMPLVGNVRLSILSERMERVGGCSGNNERLIVKWKTCDNAAGRGDTAPQTRLSGLTGDPTSQSKGLLPTAAPADSTEEGKPGRREDFCGIFIFEFDHSGRLVKHVIEHMEEGSNGDRMTRVVSVTDWLLGQLHNRRRHTDEPALAWCAAEEEQNKLKYSRRDSK